MDLITLADIPKLSGSAAKPRVTIPIGRLDSNLRDPRYGKFSITQSDVDSWKRNLDDVFGGEVSLDFDHSSDRGQGTRAAAWVKRIHQAGSAEGDLVLADVQFTRRGAKAVRNGDYKYTSPTFVENYIDEHGVKHGKALIGGALTNRPVLRKGMPTLSLSADEFEGVQVAKPANGSAPARDSRRQMATTAREDLIKLLDLAEDADTDAILAATVVTLAQASTDPGDANADADDIAAAAKAQKATKKAKKARKAAKTMAADSDGNVTLDSAQLAKLLADANAGASAHTQLAEQTFTTHWEKALTEGRAAPSQEENLRQLHKLDPELAIKTLDAFVQIVPTKPAGSGEGAQAGPAPAGMDEDRFQLHQQAKQLAAQKRTADPKLDEGEAYILAVNEISERQFQLENPGI